MSAARKQAITLYDFTNDRYITAEADEDGNLKVISVGGVKQANATIDNATQVSIFGELLEVLKDVRTHLELINGEKI